MSKAVDETKMETVTVVIPAYNVEKYINQTIDSVLNQTYPHVECIVVNDGSTDNTLDRLAAYNGQIITITQENQGRTAARNRGLETATGAYIALLDADDYWHPEKLVRQIALLSADPKIGVVGCGGFMVDSHGNIVRELQAAPTNRLSSGDNGFAALLKQEYGIAAPLSTLVFRRESLEFTGGFDEAHNTMEEWHVLLKIIHQWDIACVMEPLAYYRGYGAFTPAKVAPRKRQDKLIEVIEDALVSQSEKANFDSVAREALAKAYLRGALTDYAVDDLESALKRMTLAEKNSPALFRGSPPLAVERIAYYAAYLRDTVTPLDEVLSFVNRLFNHLPDVLDEFKGYYQQTVASCYTIWLFDAYKRRNLADVRMGARRILLHKPDLLYRNRGLQSIILESITGVRIANLVRRLL